MNTAREKSHTLLTEFKLDLWSQTSNKSSLLAILYIFVANLFTTLWSHYFAYPSFFSSIPYLLIAPSCSLCLLVIKWEFPHFPITFTSTTFWVCAHLIYLFSVLMDQLLLLVVTAYSSSFLLRLIFSCLFKDFNPIIIPPVLDTIKVFLLNPDGSFLIAHWLVIVTPFKKDKLNPASSPNNTPFLCQFCINTLQGWVSHSLLNPLNKLCLGLKYSKVLFLTRVLVTSILSIPKGNSQPSLLLCSSPSRQQGFFTFPFLKLFLHLASVIPHFPSLLPISSVISLLSSLLAPLPLLHIWKLAVPQLILQPSSLLCLLLVLTIKPKLHGLLKDL